jgi:hypothetical protein
VPKEVLRCPQCGYKVRVGPRLTRRKREFRKRVQQAQKSNGEQMIEEILAGRIIDKLQLEMYYRN